MSGIHIDLQGRFIDSFIYSGVLFTVDVNGILCTYSWSKLIDEYVRANPGLSHLRGKIIDCRTFDGHIDSDIVVEIDSDFLEKNQLGICCDLGVWSTDLDVKDNILYVSSERGFEALPLCWELGKVLKFNDLYSIWMEGKVFGMATGTWGRSILATGSTGAVEILNPEVEQLKLLGIRQQAGKTISDEVCVGCDWNKSSTIAVLDNVDSKQIIEFNRIESDYYYKSSTPQDQRKNLNSSKIDKLIDGLISERPQEIKDDSTDLACTWFDQGKNLLGVGHDGGIYSFDNKKSKWGKVDGPDTLDSQVKKVKETSVGKVVELESDHLYLVNGADKRLMSSDFVSWRVFPRSKNYQDRVHVVNEDYLRISIF